MRRSVQIALIAVFGALHAALYFISFGLWRNWAIYITPIEGIILGPGAGLLAAFLGSSIGRIVVFDPLFIFGVVAEPISVLCAGLLSRGKWKSALTIYTAMLIAYFLNPFGRQLPLWTILDVLVALFIIYPAARLSNSLFSKNFKRLSIALVSLSFVCTATDSLARIFLLVPIGLHVMVFPNYGVLEAVFIGSAVSSFVEDIIVILVSLLVGVPIIVTMSKLGMFSEENQKAKT